MKRPMGNSSQPRCLDGASRPQGGDKRFLKLIRAYLNAGVMVAGVKQGSEVGHPAGVAACRLCSPTSCSAT
jgi:hypothetical protein